MPEDYVTKAKEAGYLIRRLLDKETRQPALVGLRALYPEIEFTYNRYGLQVILPEHRVKYLSRVVQHSATRIFVRSAEGFRLIKDRRGTGGPPDLEPEPLPEKKSVWEWLRNPAV